MIVFKNSQITDACKDMFQDNKPLVDLVNGDFDLLSEYMLFKKITDIEKKIISLTQENRELREAVFELQNDSREYI